MLLNAGMDAIEVATLHIRPTARTARELVTAAAAQAWELKSDQGSSQLTLRNIPPWSLRMILLELERATQ